MLELKYNFNDKLDLMRIDIVGLTGCEQVATLKEAVSLLQLENPCKTFSQKAKTLGVYDGYSDAQMEKEAHIANELTKFWCHYDDAEQILPSMNVLSILSHVLTEYMRTVLYIESH